MKTIDELGISPTPWTAGVYGFIRDGSRSNTTHYIASCSTKNMDDNARLIAAAPDCYDALRRIVSATEGAVMDFPKRQKDLQKALDDAKKAIEKAGGGNE